MREYQVSRYAVYDMEEDEIRIRLPMEVDDTVCKNIYKEMEEFTRHQKLRYLLFDFSRVEFMDSSGVGLLLSVYRRMRERGGRTGVCGTNRRIQRMLTLAGIYQVVEQVEIERK